MSNQAIQRIVRAVFPMMLLGGNACTRTGEPFIRAELGSADNGITILWTFTNPLSYAVWIPVEQSADPLPAPYLTPDGELVFVSAHLKAGDQRWQVMPVIEDWTFRCRKVESGKSVTGRLRITFPYDPKPTFTNPFELEGYGDTKKEFERIREVVFVTEYYTCDPERWGRKPETNEERECAWTSMVKAIIEGTKTYGVRALECPRIAVSNRLAVEIPLSPGKEIFCPRFSDPSTEF